MNPAATTSTLHRWINGILIALFMALLWLPGLDSVFHFDWTPQRSENRAMAAYPKLQPGWHGLQAYIAGLEAYFNDHFGCRKCLVQWQNKLELYVFKDRVNHDVLFGKDNWLFFSEGQMVEHYSGQLQFTPEQLHDWQVLLEKRRDWLARRGIAYVFVAAPDKQSIYPEYLPSWVKKIRPQTKLDQFFAYMHAHSTVPVLDLRDVVRDAKQIRPTYLKTDTHWNFFGGFMAYQELVKTLAGQVPGLDLQPEPITSFTVTNRLTAGGDMARILGLSMTESNAYFLLPKPELPKFTEKTARPDHPKDPKYTDNPQAGGRVIFFHDSFALTWFEFLPYNFNHVTYLWQYDLDSAWIEREKPDLVVSEMLERFFNIQDPKALMAKEALN